MCVWMVYSFAALNIQQGYIYYPGTGDSLVSTGRMSIPILKKSGTITRSSAASSGTQNVTTGFEPSMIIFSAVDDGDDSVGSSGTYDGMSSTVISAATVRQTESVWVESMEGDGWKAHVSATSTTGFTLDWTKVGAGKNVTVKYTAMY